MNVTGYRSEIRSVWSSDKNRSVTDRWLLIITFKWLAMWEVYISDDRLGEFHVCMCNNYIKGDMVGESCVINYSLFLCVFLWLANKHQGKAAESAGWWGGHCLEQLRAKCLAQGHCSGFSGKYDLKLISSIEIRTSDIGEEWNHCCNHD